MNPPALILHATGTNRDHEAAQAIELAGGQPEIVHLNQLRSGERRWSDYQMLVLPGGFSYADALGAGRLLALDLNAYFSDEVRTFVESGQAGDRHLQRLPGAGEGGDLLACRDGNTDVPGSSAAQSSEASDAHLQRPRAFRMPLGDAEARVAAVPLDARPERADLLPGGAWRGQLRWRMEGGWPISQASDQIALAYALPDGSPARGAYPHNPNGSIADIAGHLQPQGNVLGLMPHPEDHLFAWQHPRWSRGARRWAWRCSTNGVKYAQAIIATEHTENTESIRTL